MTATGGARVAVAIIAIAIVGGSLTGCARGLRSGLQSGEEAPAAGVSASTATPAPATGVSNSTLRDIQSDLDATDSSTANADGDVADADNSAATNDSP